MKKGKIKRFIAVLLAVSLLFSMISVIQTSAWSPCEPEDDILPDANVPVVDPDMFYSGIFCYKLRDGFADIYRINANKLMGDEEVIIPEEIDGHKVEKICGLVSHDNRSYNSNFRVIIPKTVKEISEGAFANIKYHDYDGYNPTTVKSYISAESIEVDPENAYFTAEDGVLYNKNRSELIAYPKEKSDTDFTIPSTVEKICKNAFALNSNLKNVTVPDSVKEIGDGAFAKMLNLSSVSMGKGLKTIGENAFFECEKINNIIIPNGVTNIGKGAFAYCRNLNNITLSNKLSEISDYMLSHCSLESISIPASVVSIGKNGFASTDKLNNIKINNGLKIIESNAFAGTGIENITLPKSVQSISETAFRSAYYLKSIEVDSDNPYYSSKDGVLYNKAKTNLILYPIGIKNKTFTVPDSVTEINNAAFLGSDLETLKISDSVETIGESAFYYCKNLKNITLPKNLTTIPTNAFSCSGIEEINIPKKVTEIKKNAFGTCDSLKKVTIPGNVKSIAESAFQKCSKLDEVIIEEGCEYIGPNAFGQKGIYTSNVGKLDIYIPQSVCEIDFWAFYYTKDVTIHGYKNSVAEIFAKDNDIKFENISNSQTSKSISDMQISLNQNKYTYDGTAKRPSALVKDGENTLVENKDYTLTYANNVKAGTAEVTVSGVGDYTGNVKKTFTISPRSLSTASIELSQTSFSYDGSPKEPLVKVSIDGVELTNEADYTVSYSNNIKVGTAAVSVSGKGNYTGTKSADFKIVTRSIANAVVSVESVSYEYDGKEKRPSVSVHYDGKMLVLNTDYTVSYSNNINAGTATITVTGKGTYSGQQKKTFSIARKSVTKLDINVDSKNNTSSNPDVTVKYGSITLVKNSDYTQTISLKETTVTVVIKGIGNYTGSTTINYTLKKKSIASENVALGTTKYTYDGTAKKPSVTVTVGSVKLTNGVDYQLSYEYNIDASDCAYAVVKGIGSYTGTVRKRFTILPCDFSKASVNLSQTSFTYDGNEKKPAVSAKYGSKNLTQNTDFVISSYYNNINAGVATVTVSGKNNYSGEVQKTFNINPKSVSSLDIKLSKTEFAYTGYAQAPVVTVYNGSEKLTNGIDYTIKEGNNVNVGTASVTVIGCKNYTGSVTKNYRITGSSLSGATVTLSNKSYTYDGTEKRPSVTVKLNGIYLESTCYTVNYSNNRNAGTATVTVTGKGNYSGTVKESFSIAKRQISAAAATLSALEYTYDGTEKKPAVSVKDGNQTLSFNADYSVSYQNNVNTGTAQVIITGKGNYTGTLIKYFTINKSKTGFTWGEDNFNFNNWGNGYYFRNTTYRKQISSSYLNVLKENTNPIEWLRISGEPAIVGNTIYYLNGTPLLDRQWGGSCYGMAALGVVAKEGVDIPYSQYVPGATKLYDLQAPNKNSKVESLVTYYYCLQQKDIIIDKGIENRGYSNGKYEINIKRIISELDKHYTTLICFYFFDHKYGSWAGHAILGYGYESGSYKIGGKTYTGRIKTCDSNRSTRLYSSGESMGLAPDEDCYIYFDNQYNWTIPLYETGVPLSYKGGADFGYIGSDLNEVNDGGYYSTGSKAVYSSNYAQLTTDTISEDNTVEKIENVNGNFLYRYNVTKEKEIEESHFGDLSGESEPEPGYVLKDADTSYRVSQPESQKLSLTMNYPDTLMSAYSGSAKTAVFEKYGYVSVEGENAGYNLSVTSNENNPTDWFTMSVGGTASEASLKMTEDGYVLTADNLNNVHIIANNKDITAQTTFSSSASSVLIYEIDENTIGVKADSDDNGTFETEVKTNSKSISGCKVELSARKFSYDGNEQKPLLKVTENGNTLAENKDYTVTYENSYGEGIATVIVTGINGYSGTLFEKYYIEGDIKIGDVDGSGDKLNAKDRAKLTRYVAKWKDSEKGFNESVADLNLDGKVNAIDRIILTRYIANYQGYDSLPYKE